MTAYQCGIVPGRDERRLSQAGDLTTGARAAYDSGRGRDAPFEVVLKELRQAHEAHRAQLVA